MFNDLFLKSIKKQKVDFLKERNFVNYNNDNFKPSNKKEVRYFKESVIFSKNDKDLKFTNFLSVEKNDLELERLNNFFEDLTYLIEKENSSTYVNFGDKRNKDRINNIIQLFIDDFDYNLLEDDSIRKIALINELGQNENVRVYFMLTNKFDAYEIILIDPFHLVIPSGKDTKARKKQITANYEFNKDNVYCISNFYEV